MKNKYLLVRFYCSFTKHQLTKLTQCMQSSNMQHLLL